MIVALASPRIASGVLVQDINVEEATGLLNLATRYAPERYQESGLVGPMRPAPLTLRP